ncbi:MAG: FtsW/RodA/SpoVE family cell cycle protein, partial [Verrucomicrobiota bacterium]
MSSQPASSASPLPLPGVSLLVVALAVALSVLGLIVLLSAAQATHGGSFELARKQAIWLGLSLVAGFVAWRMPLDFWRWVTWPAAGLALLFSLAVLHPAIGSEINGARRWIVLGPVSFQVAELLKLALVLVLAGYLGQNRRRRRSFWRGFCLPGGIIGLAGGLLILQPDFGTAALCGAVGGVLLFMAGVPWRYLIPAASLALAAFSTLVYFNPVRLERITAFLDLEANKQDGAYQLWQGLVGFGVGGLSGVGLGNGGQQQYYLPEAHNDFIFAVIGEELGFFFTAGIALCYLLLFLGVLWKLREAPNLYQCLLVLGLTLFIVFQSLINMGVVTGLLPTKGMSLPFISYGGSNLLFLALFIGIILNAFRNWNAPTL